MDFEQGTGISVENWNKSEEWIQERAGKISTNPIAAFRLIKRYGKLLPKLIKKIEKESPSTSTPFKDLKILEFPDETDFVDALGGLLRLHVFYKLNVTEVWPDFEFFSCFMQASEFSTILPL